MKRPSALAFVAGVTLATTAAIAADSPWNDTFSRGPAVHFVARFRDARGDDHRLEVWRDGDRVRRDTDGQITLVSQGTSGERRFSLVDRRRRVVLDVSEPNLHRIGVMSDFDALGGRPARPLGATAARDLGQSHGTPAGRCRWFRAVAKAETGDFCWSTKLGVVLEARDAAGKTTYRVEQAESTVKAEAFRVDVTGFVRMDADQEIHPDD